MREWIRARDSKTGEKPSDCGDSDDEPNAAESSLQAVLNARQEWIMAEVAKRGKIARLDVQRQFGVSEKTARADLAGLVRTGKLEFASTPKPGNYRSTQASEA